MSSAKALGLTVGSGDKNERAFRNNTIGHGTEIVEVRLVNIIWRVCRRSISLY